MANLAIHKPKTITRGPQIWPVKYRIPGDLTRLDGRIDISGPIRRTIIHDLFFHQIPNESDKIIDKLPPEESFQQLNPIQQHFLSFTLYSLKQMISAFTIDSTFGYALFFDVLEHIKKVTEQNLGNFRRSLVQKVRDNIQETDLTKDKSLLEFEFWARTDTVLEIDKFNSWAQNLIFEQEMPYIIKEEYGKALWIEMRKIEKYYGSKSLNLDIRYFSLDLNNEGGRYVRGINALSGEINLFKHVLFPESGGPIDAALRAEIGHWYFSSLFPSPEITEFPDRSYIQGFTPAISDPLNNSPEAKVFRLGSYRVLQNPFPSFPHQFLPCFHSARGFDPSTAMKDMTHSKMEQLVYIAIRNLLLKIPIEQHYDLYRKLAFYIILLEKEGPFIEYNIQSLDIDKLNEYYEKRNKKILSFLEQELEKIREKLSQPGVDIETVARIPIFSIAMEKIKRGQHLES